MGAKSVMTAGSDGIQERRRELLRRRLAERGVAAAVAPAPDRTDARLPLSQGQRRMWFVQTRDPQDTAFNICVAYRLSGALEHDRLRAAVHEVARRHEILRTTYGLGDDGEPYQLIHSELPPRWQHHDLSQLPESARPLRAEVLARREFGRPFDLASDSPLRITMVRTGFQEHVLVLVVHHICWDDDSWAVFFGELNAAYQGRELPALRGQFLDAGEAEVSDGDIEFWRNALRPLPEPLELPGGTTDSGIDAAERRVLALPAALLERAEAFAREHAATPFMVLLAAYQATVHRYTAATDFLTSVPVTLRGSAMAESLIGYFGNTVLLRAELRPADTFAPLTAAVRETCLAAFAHQHVGIDRAVRDANPGREAGRDGFDHLVKLGFSMRKSANGFDLDGITATELDLGNPAAQSPLGLAVVTDSAGARLEAHYRTGEVDSAVVESMLAHYVNLLGSALADPDRRLGEADLLGAEGRAEVLRLSYGEQVAATAKTMVELFRARVAAAPDAVAIIVPDADGRDAELTYAELSRRANRLARWLIGRGIGTEDIIGLCMTNSMEFVVAMLAVLEAGRPICRSIRPTPRTGSSYLIEDAAPRMVLDRNAFADAEREAAALTSDAPSDAERVRPLRPGNLAYVIYTSGSTGRPKGVPVPHNAIAEHLEGFAAQWGMTAADRLLQSSSVSFDASLLDIFVTFTVGARLVIPKPDAFRDIPYVADVIARCGVTVLHMVPSMLSTFLLLPEVAQWRALRHVPVGGEALPGEVADRFATVFDAELRNHYGPTEAVVCSTHMPVRGPQGTRTVPIGRPNRNVSVYLLDAALQLVPAGVVGEIYLGGAQLRAWLPGPARARGAAIRRRSVSTGSAAVPNRRPGPAQRRRRHRIRRPRGRTGEGARLPHRTRRGGGRGRESSRRPALRRRRRAGRGGRSDARRVRRGRAGRRPRRGPGAHRGPPSGIHGAQRISRNRADSADRARQAGPPRAARASGEHRAPIPGTGHRHRDSPRRTVRRAVRQPSRWARTIRSSSSAGIRCWRPG